MEAVGYWTKEDMVVGHIPTFYFRFYQILLLIKKKKLLHCLVRSGIKNTLLISSSNTPPPPCKNRVKDEFCEDKLY